MIVPIAAAVLAGTVVVAPALPAEQATTFPVEEVLAPGPEGIVFSEASVDGAVTDTAGRDFRLDSDVLFAFDRSALNSRAKREITTVAGKLRSKSVTTVSVTGYTDDVGSDDYNLKLSKRRAQAVRKALSAALGGEVRVTAKGLGEADPIADNDKASGRTLNRRVEVRTSS